MCVPLWATTVPGSKVIQNLEVNKPIRNRVKESKESKQWQSVAMEKRSDHTTMPSVSRHCREECEKIRKNMLHRCTIGPYCCENGAADVVALCRAILESTSVKKIYFDNPDLMDSSLGRLSDCLRSCKSLEAVVLYGRNARSLLPSIAVNDRIRCLKLGFQVEAVDLANTIKTSTGLRRLELQTGTSSADLPNYSAYSADELALVAEACRRNQSIEELCSHNFKDIPVGSTLISNLGPNLPTVELQGVCDGAAVRDLLRNSQRLSTLRFKYATLTPEDCLAIKDGLSQNFSLRELEFDDVSTPEDTELLMGDVIRAASSIERLRLIYMIHDRTQAWHSVFESLAQHSNIQRISLATRLHFNFGPGVVNLLERKTRLQYLDLGYLSGDAVDDLARGLAATTSLVELRIRLVNDTSVDMLHLLFDQGISQCPTLERLYLSLNDLHLDNGPLAQLVEKNRTIRCLHLDFDRVVVNRRMRVLAEVVDAIALNGVLERFRLDSYPVPPDEELASSLAAALPKLWSLKTLNIPSVQLPEKSEHVLHQLDLNMSLTDFVVGTSDPDDNDSKEVKRIVRRNQSLHASRYGQAAAPSLWPAMIHLALQNEHVGPTMVYHLLSKRSGVVASYVPIVNVRPASDGCVHDGGSVNESGMARRRME